MSSRPLVSIITAVYNGRQFIEEAIQSVFNQTCQPVQYIIMDGGSTDGTLSIIGKHANRIDVVCSGKDRGIADAWNKGLMHAKGDILGFLNSDDWYDPRTLETVIQSLRKNDLTITYGDVVFVDRASGRLLERSRGHFEPGKLLHGFGFFHTSCFFSRVVLERVGMFSTRYRIAIDTDWLLRGIKKGVSFSHAGNTTYMRTGGVSFARQEAASSEYLRQLVFHGFFRKEAVCHIARRLLRRG